jgi:hypothetical protein
LPPIPRLTAISSSFLYFFALLPSYKHYDSGFNYVIRTTTITSPVWFKTLSFTYFHDYLQAYRALANSTDAAISSSLLSASLFFAKLLALGFSPNYINSYDNNVLYWFKTIFLRLDYDYFALASISIDSTDCAMATSVDFGSPPLFMKLDAL